MNNSECVICLTELDTSIITIECNHVYHQKCIDTWLINNKSCPICRTISNRIVPENTAIVIYSRVRNYLRRVLILISIFFMIFSITLIIIIVFIPMSHPLYISLNYILSMLIFISICTLICYREYF